VDEAWHNWGWQKSLGYSRADSTRLWNDYQYLFEGILPETVNEFAPATVYVPSSPANGWGRDKAYRQGDVHYWGVWWGNEPFETYNEKVGRFVSEYGFQGMPDRRTIESFTLPEDRNLGSEVMAVHQKHPRGKELIGEYMERDYLIPSKLEDYIYVSQLLQARGIKTAIEAHRRAKPYNMGTLYWQFNDCWPVTSWSGIDVDHRWKALQYSVQKAYDRFLISFTQEKDSLSIWMVGDCYVDRTPQLTWQLITFDGDTLAAGKNTFAFPMGSSVVALKLDLRSLLIPLSVKNKVVLKASVRDQNESLADALHYFCRPKELLLSPDPGLSLSAIPDTLKYKITLTTRKLAKNIWLQSSTDGWFSNNYFDLLPGETQTISFTPHKASKSLPIFTVTSLGQIN
jgi:beta-mannosidase